MNDIAYSKLLLLTSYIFIVLLAANCCYLQFTDQSVNYYTFAHCFNLSVNYYIFVHFFTNR